MRFVINFLFHASQRKTFNCYVYTFYSAVYSTVPTKHNCSWILKMYIVVSEANNNSHTLFSPTLDVYFVFRPQVTQPTSNQITHLGPTSRILEPRGWSAQRAKNSNHTQLELSRYEAVADLQNDQWCWIIRTANWLQRQRSRREALRHQPFQGSEPKKRFGADSGPKKLLQAPYVLWLPQNASVEGDFNLIWNFIQWSKKCVHLTACTKWWKCTTKTQTASNPQMVVIWQIKQFTDLLSATSHSIPSHGTISSLFNRSLTNCDAYLCPFLVFTLCSFSLLICTVNLPFIILLTSLTMQHLTET